ncbi:hypothetical protein HK405_000172 [Cladochytrium tenue]|nr:hypothetical protein HK405_000172 [Cladochytrium tenue]
MIPDLDNEGRRSSAAIAPPVPTRRRFVLHEDQTGRPAIKTLDRIVASDAFELDPYRPPVKRNGADEKDRLVAFMESDGRWRSSAAAAAAAAASCDNESPPPPTELDEVDLIRQEIEERRQWLDDMVALGHGEKFRRSIQAEIGEGMIPMHKQRLRLCTLP